MLDEIINYVQSLQNQVEVPLSNSFHLLIHIYIYIFNVQYMIIINVGFFFFFPLFPVTITVPFNEACFFESHAL